MGFWKFSNQICLDSVVLHWKDVTILSYIGKGFDNKTLVQQRLKQLWLQQVPFEFVASHIKVTLAPKNPVSSSCPFIILSLRDLDMSNFLQYNNGFIYLAHFIGSI